MGRALGLSSKQKSYGPVLYLRPAFTMVELGMDERSPSSEPPWFGYFFLAAIYPLQPAKSVHVQIRSPTTTTPDKAASSLMWRRTPNLPLALNGINPG